MRSTTSSFVSFARGGRGAFIPVVVLSFFIRELSMHIRLCQGRSSIIE
jgi:hypothetical protein